MTNTFKIFYTCALCPSNIKIITVDSYLNTIIGKGDINFSPIIVLKSLLHVLKLCINIVSVSKLSQD